MTILRLPVARSGSVAFALLLIHCSGVSSNKVQSSGNDPPDGSTSDSDVDGRTGADAGGPGEGGIPCSVDAGARCPGALSCCEGWCTNTAEDPRNCGMCGNACSTTQFCTGLACDDAVLPNICANPSATVIQDQYAIDNQAGAQVAQALAGCTPPVTYWTTTQDGGALDPTTHRPLLGPGQTLIAGGGAYGQSSVAYLDSAGDSPAYIVENTTDVWIYDRATDVAVVHDLVANLTASHDYFLLVLAVEPISGTLCFTAAGPQAPGTTAAAYYFTNVVMPALSTFTGSWYALEWTDTNMDGVPDAGDTFTTRGSG
jgi:hypothetical protein